MQVLLERTLTATALNRRIADVYCRVISSDSVLRRLRKHNLTSHPPTIAPLLTAAYRKERLAFTGIQLNWAINEWRHVLFTDESRFTRYSFDNSPRVFRRPGERYIQYCFSPSVQLGGGGIFLEARTALIMFLGDSMNADRFIRVEICWEL